MKNLDKDILRDSPELKENAYGVPEGYFDGLKAGLKMIPQREMGKKTGPVWRWAVAAAVAVLIAVGGILAGISSEQPENYAEASGLTEDEIIEYLIYSGVEVEELEEY